MKYNVVVVGGGPAGLGAAIEAKRNGANDVLIIERDRELGGILNQCIHNGFGLHEFKEELTNEEFSKMNPHVVAQKLLNKPVTKSIGDIFNLTIGVGGAEDGD